MKKSKKTKKITFSCFFVEFSLKYTKMVYINSVDNERGRNKDGNKQKKDTKKMESIIKFEKENKEAKTMASIIKSALKKGLQEFIKNNVEKVMNNKGVEPLIRKIYEININIISNESISVTASIRHHFMKYGFCEVTFWMNDKFQMDERKEYQFIRVFAYNEAII